MTDSPVPPLDHFFDMFEKAGQAECAIFESTSWTYADLRWAITQDSKALAESGVHAGDVVVTTGEFGLRHLALFFALAWLGAMIVPLPEIEESELARCIDIAQATFLAVVGQDGSWTASRTGRTAVHPLLQRLLARREAGLVVFTSGSTGDKKGVVHSLPRLLAKYRVGRKTLRTLAFLKLDHLGGLNTVLYALANHGAVVFPRCRKVDDICRLIERHRIELLPSTPSFLRLLLLSGCQSRYDLSSLQLITYGTELMSIETLQRLHRSFPGVRLQQTYGLSELGVLRSKSLESGSAWVKVGGEDFQTRVLDGTLWIKANSAMEGYLNHPNPFDKDGWFDTEDKVEVQGEFVRFLGRESEVINVAGEKVFPCEVENFLLGLKNVADAAVSSEPNPLLGHIVTARVVLTSPEPEAEACQRLRRACRRSLRPFMVPVKIRLVPEIEYSERYKKVRSEARSRRGPAP